jgi:integrase
MSSIARRDGGGWRARYRDEAGKEHSRHFTRKIEAQRWIDETTAAIVTGQYVDPKAGRITFMSYYRDWSVRQVWVPGTVKAMDLAVRTTTFAGLELGTIRRSHVEVWVRTMNAAGLAPGTVKTRVNNVRSVLRAAVRDRIIATDPSEAVNLPRPRRAEAAMGIPTSTQVAAVLAAADERFHAFISLSAFAGLRLGEAAALQVGDVDFLRRILMVSRQVQRANGGEIEIRAPKYGSERTIFLADGLLDVLSAHVKNYCATGDKRSWLFEATPGRPPHQNTVGHQWRQACKRAGVTGLTLHSLRHFYASGLIAAGCDVVTVQRALGHAKATTTLNTYAHLWPNAEDRTRRATDDLMAEVAHEILADSLRTLATPQASDLRK